MILLYDKCFSNFRNSDNKGRSGSHYMFIIFSCYSAHLKDFQLFNNWPKNGFTEKNET